MKKIVDFHERYTKIFELAQKINKVGRSHVSVMYDESRLRVLIFPEGWIEKSNVLEFEVYKQEGVEISLNKIHRIEKKLSEFLD